MGILSKFFIKLPVKNYRFKSTLKILRKTSNGWKVIETKKTHDLPALENGQTPKTNNDTNNKNDEINDVRETETKSPEYRENEMKIQMLSKHLHEQIFGSSQIKTADQNIVKKYQNL